MKPVLPAVPTLLPLPALIDSHCHLDHDFSPKTIEDLIHESTENGIEALITIGTTLDTLPTLQNLSERFSPVYHTVGIHPHDCHLLEAKDLNTLRVATRHPKCRAIGEIGLDYYYEHSPRDLQKNWLKQQLDLALEVRLPIVIHSRDGEMDLIPVLETYVSQLPPHAIPGVIHCFSGTLEFGRICLALGFYISFSGILTFKKAENVHQAAQEFPLDRLLVETDAPYLAPIPYRGKKCEPVMIRQTAMKLAELKQISIDEVARTTTANAKKVFQIIN